MGAGGGGGAGRNGRETKEDFIFGGPMTLKGASVEEEERNEPSNAPGKRASGQSRAGQGRAGCGGDRDTKKAKCPRDSNNGFERGLRFVTV